MFCFVRFVVVQSAGQENSNEEGNSQSRWHGTGAHDSSYSDSDEEEETKGIITGTFCGYCLLAWEGVATMLSYW